MPELSYDRLAIKQGDEAMIKWWQMVDGSLSAEEQEQIGDDLKRYCGLDTLAMVEVW